MALDVSGFNYFMPVFLFLLVFFIVYAILTKIKVTGDNKLVHAVVSFIVAIIFLVFASSRDVVLKFTPWVAVLLVLLFFIMLLVGFTQKSLDTFMEPWIAWVFVAILVIIFLVVLLKVMGYGLIDTFDSLSDFYTDYPKIFGALSILIVAILAAWVVVKK
jgi:hypothetical protein